MILYGIYYIILYLIILMLGMGPGPHLRPCRSAQAVVTAKGGCILAIPLGEMGRSWLLFVLPQAITGPWGSVETKPWNILEPSNMETGEPWKPPYIVEVLRKAMRTVKLWKPWKPQRRNNHHRGKAMETVENMALETISCSTWQLCPCPCCPCPPCSTDLYSSSLPLRPTSPTCLHISRPFFFIMFALFARVCSCCCFHGIYGTHANQENVEARRPWRNVTKLRHFPRNQA